MSVDDPTARQKAVENDVEKGYTQGEAVGRQAAREAGLTPPDAHGHTPPDVHGFDRPGSSRAD
jgi:hypothetical protein